MSCFLFPLDSNLNGSMLFYILFGSALFELYPLRESLICMEAAMLNLFIHLTYLCCQAYTETPFQHVIYCVLVLSCTLLSYFHCVWKKNDLFYSRHSSSLSCPMNYRWQPAENESLTSPSVTLQPFKTWINNSEVESVQALHFYGHDKRKADRSLL